MKIRFADFAASVSSSRAPANAMRCVLQHAHIGDDGRRKPACSCVHRGEELEVRASRFHPRHRGTQDRSDDWLAVRLHANGRRVVAAMVLSACCLGLANPGLPAGRRLH
jgi:hypothetical protein